VHQHTRRAADRSPHERRDDGVGGVLGQGLHGGPGQLLLVQVRGVPGAQVPQPVASGREVASREVGRHHPTFAGQAPAAEGDPCRERDEGGLRDRTVARSPLGQRGDDGHGADASPAAHGSPGPAVRPEPPLHRGEGGPEGGDGMAPHRVAECGVEQEAERDPHRTGPSRHGTPWFIATASGKTTDPGPRPPAPGPRPPAPGQDTLWVLTMASGDALS